MSYPFLLFCFLVWESPRIMRVLINLMIFLSWIRHAWIIPTDIYRMHELECFETVIDCFCCDFKDTQWMNERVTVVHFNTFYNYLIFFLKSYPKILPCAWSTLRPAAAMSLWTACKTHNVLGWHLYLLLLFYISCRMPYY